MSEIRAYSINGAVFLRLRTSDDDRELLVRIDSLHTIEAYRSRTINSAGMRHTGTLLTRLDGNGVKTSILVTADFVSILDALWAQERGPARLQCQCDNDAGPILPPPRPWWKFWSRGA